MDKYVIGIDLGGMSAKAALLNGEQLFGTSRWKTDKNNSAQATAQDLAELVREVVKKSGASMSQIAAVGIGAPGAIDSKNGVVARWANFNWSNVPLAKLVEEELELPVFVLNDANAAALGEYEFGAGKEFSSTVMITLGTGVGGGIVFDGLFEGNKGAGGEIGHMVIHTNGAPCTCGRKGCLEAYVSATALIRQTKEEMQKHRESDLWRICEGDIVNVDGKTAFDGVRAGDQTAEKIVRNYINNLAEGVANVGNLFRPEAVILGGGISAEGEALTAPVEAFTNKHILGGEYASVRVVTAQLGNDAGIYGAAAFAKKKIENN